jgi:hypothetical protein
VLDQLNRDDRRRHGERRAPEEVPAARGDVHGQGSAAVGRVEAFFTPSQTSTDFDQLQLMNNDLIGRVHKVLEPLLVQDWKSRYDAAIKSAEPAFRTKL